MTGFEDRRTGVQLPYGGEELMGDALAEGEIGRELEENGTEFAAETTDGAEEVLKCFSGVAELCGMGDGFGRFHGETEVIRRGGSPALPGGKPVWPVKAGVDLDTGKVGGVTHQVLPITLRIDSLSESKLVFNLADKH